MQSWMLRGREVIAINHEIAGVRAISRWDNMPAPVPDKTAPGRIITELKNGERHGAVVKAERNCYALVKITYFPDLVAQVDRHQAPVIRVSPDFAAVTSGYHLVEVYYRPGLLEPFLFFVGLAVFVLTARSSFLWRRQNFEARLRQRLEVINDWLVTERAKTPIALAVLVLLFTRALFRFLSNDSEDFPLRFVWGSSS
jgi:hypothetical protein